jgi:hypothetical protein
MASTLASISNMSISDNTLSNSIFSRTRDKIARQTYRPWIIETSAGDSLAVVINRKKNDNFNGKKVSNSLYYGITSCPGTRCNTCRSFMIHNASYIFQNNITISSSDSDHAIHTEYEKYFTINTSPDIYIIEKSRHGEESSGGFDHFYFDTSDISKIISRFTAADYEWFIHQHLPTMIRLLITNCNDGIIESLDVLIETLPKVTYGDKLEKSAIWFRAAIDEYMNHRGNTSDKTIIAIKHLLRAPLSPGVDEERIICTYLKQVKDNTINAMAVAHNESALRYLLQERFKPTNYCRPTAPPKDGQLSQAIKMFTDLGFSTSVMLVSNIPKYGGKLVSSANTMKDATNIWSNQLGSKKKAGAAGLASRSSPSFPTTIKELFDNLENYPGLKISTVGMFPVLLTEYPDSARDALIHPHLWCFNNGQSISIYGISSGFQNISAITFMGRNVFFGIKGSRLTHSSLPPKNTCFPEFLTPAYQRKCRSAFEDLNKKTSPSLPTNDGNGYALGVGTSQINSLHCLHSAIEFSYNGRKFTIRLME